MLDTLDTQLVQYGLYIQQKRKIAIYQFNEIFGKLYEEITGIDGVTIAYHPSWKEIEDDENTKHFPSPQEKLELLK